ncbi:MAG: phosphomannomutase/phosphoglucomutase [Calditrichaeota bacterium]|nr:MAG: phosphomannomutase/phosphoglucomutase [Calditrichota bacterium]
MATVNPYIFREYDIRGVVGEDLTDSVVELLGRGIGTYLRNHGVETISLGGDVRLSTEQLRAQLTAGLRATGINIVDLGAVPTPVQYFSLHKLPVQGGIMITGSHNPPEFNGFKISLGTGPVYGEEIQKIREIIDKQSFTTGKGSLRSYNIIPEYIDDITSRLTLKRPVKVVIDCGNGAASLVSKELFTRLGAEVQFLYCEPDGRFPNHHPDPTVLAYIQDLIQTVKNGDAELGIGFDGDADRIGVVNPKGEPIWGDRLLLLFALEVLQRQKGAKIIFDVKCSQALPEAIEAAGGIPIMWKTGHSLLKKKMKEEKAPLGGEMSGHIFFADNYYGYDDAIYAAARLLALLSRDNRTIDDYLAGVPKYYSTPETRLECASDEEKFKIARKAAEYFKAHYKTIDVDGVRILFGDGWGLVRASNTQPVIVVRFEAKTPERLEEIKTLVLNKLKEFGEIKI